MSKRQSEMFKEPGEHDWQKDCLVSGADTPYKCSRCGAEAIRYGLSWPPLPKGKYRAEKWTKCPGKVIPA